MKPLSLNQILLLIGFVAVALLGGEVLLSDRAIILNPEGFGAVAYPVAGLVALLASGAGFWAVRRDKNPVAMGLVTAPFAALFAVVLVIGVAPLASLLVSGSAKTVAVEISASKSVTRSRACTSSKTQRPVMTYYYEIAGQPPMINRICVPSLRGRSSSGQLVLTPPPLPEVGPAWIDGRGNWFVVEIEEVRPR